MTKWGKSSTLLVIYSKRLAELTSGSYRQKNQSNFLGTSLLVQENHGMTHLQTKQVHLWMRFYLGRFWLFTLNDDVALYTSQGKHFCMKEIAKLRPSGGTFASGGSLQLHNKYSSF